MRKQQQSYLTNLFTKGTLHARVARRVSVLLQLHQGSDLNKIATSLGVVYQTVAQWCDKYYANGLDFLTDQKRPGRPW